MTAKEKAFELINNVSCEMEQLPYSFCKSVALLIVDQIMETIFPAQFKAWNNDKMNSEYWQEVKSEIEKI